MTLNNENDIGVNKTSNTDPWIECRDVFAGGSVVKNVPANPRDMGLVPGLGRSPGEGNDDPLQSSCLGNPMDRGAQPAMVHSVARSWTRWVTQQQQEHSEISTVFSNTPFDSFRWMMSDSCSPKKIWLRDQGPGLITAELLCGRV